MIHIQSKKLGNYDVLDVAKWLCSIMVVIIHCVPLRPYSFFADVLTAQGVCRVAVPLFFSISGFLLFSKVQLPFRENRIQNRMIIFRYIKNIFFTYSVWSIVYFAFPIIYQYGGVDLALIVKQTKLFFLEASYYHFWYLLATIYAIPLVITLL